MEVVYGAVLSASAETMLRVGCTKKPAPTIWSSQSGFLLGSLRRTFSNLTPHLKTLVTRWKRGVYRVSQRPETTPMEDSRGAVVRRIEHLQTSLTAAEVDRLVDDYLTVRRSTSWQIGTACIAPRCRLI